MIFLSLERNFFQLLVLRPKGKWDFMLNAYFLMKKGNLIMELNGYKKGCTDDVMKLRVK
jgi:hypothetical protein